MVTVHQPAHGYRRFSLTQAAARGCTHQWCRFGDERDFCTHGHHLDATCQECLDLEHGDHWSGVFDA